MSRLPSGYTHLEYIESSGTQYVDTGVKPNQSTRVVVDTEFPVQAAAAWLFGARNGNTDRTYGFLTFKNAYRSDYNTTTTEGTISETPSGRFTLDKDGNVTKINGDTVKTAGEGTFQCTHTLFLFANNNNGATGGQCSAKIYSSQIYSGGALARDFVPCKNASGAVGLYDTVKGQFYANAGTGTFAAGPEILPPAAPTGLQTVLAVVLKWAASANADRYDVYRDGAKLGSTETTQYVDATPEANQTYVYTVKAVNGGGESAGTSITVYTKSGYFAYKPLIESANFP